MAVESIGLKSFITESRPGDGHSRAETGDQKGLDADELQLARLGKKQRLLRRFGLIPIVGLVCTLLVTWEGALILLPQSLSNGGPLGTVCGFTICWMGVLSQDLVMVVMASMMPIAGGAYNWVSLLASPRYSRFMSYMTGWVTAIAGQAGAVIMSYAAVKVLQAIIILNYPAYEPSQWHQTLVLFAILLLALVTNTLLARQLPTLESIILLIHIFGFFGVLIPLVYLGPKGDPQEIFQELPTQEAGAQQVSVSWWDLHRSLLASSVSMEQLIWVGAARSPILRRSFDPFADNALAEEVPNASKVLRQAMISTVLLTGLSCLLVLLALFFCAADLDAATKNSTSQPFFAIFMQAMGSDGGATGMAAIVFVAMVFGVLGFIATASRMLWAFAREKALPARHISLIPSPSFR